jgi:esterase/lipase superfamily enzyme/TRAP-type C4-dicarboxylate transport system substrate-binding protein
MLHITIRRIITIRSILSCLIVLCATQIGSAQNAVTIRFEAALPEGTAIAQAAREFAQDTNRKLGDLAHIEIVQNAPDPMLTLRRLTQGEVAMALIPTPVALAFTDDRDFAIFDLPFFFNDLREVQALEDSALGVELLTALSTHDVLGLGFWNGGMSKLFGQAVTSPGQLKGLKLRSTASPVVMASTDKLGISVQFLPRDEVAPAIKTHLIDAAELPPHFVARDVVNIERTSISPANYRPLVSTVVVNRTFWKNLPFQVQLVVADAVRSTARRATDLAIELDTSAVATLRQREFNFVSLNPGGQQEIKAAALSSWGFALPAGPGSLLAAAIEYFVGRGSDAIVPARNTTRPPVNVPILFGTDRADERVVDPHARFGQKRGPLLYGKSLVGVGPDHPVGDSSSTVLGPIELYQKDEFQTQLSSLLEKAPEKNVLLYIHGYNNTFADAVESATLLAVDMKFQGAVVVYSWPSAGATLDYLGDEDEVLASRANFVEFITAVHSVPHLERLHVLTHSMGGRLITEALDWMNGRNGYGNSFLYHLVLAAPDIYTSRFKLALGSFVALSDDVTLYASSNDEALACSDRVAHGKPRAGEAGANIVVEPKLDTLDASPADPRTWKNFICTPVGHSYITRNAAVLGDFQNLIVANIPPAKRFRLLPRQKDGLDYWAFQPAP